MRLLYRLLFSTLFLGACTPAALAHTVGTDRQEALDSTAVHQPSPTPEIQSTCSGVPSPAMAAKRQSEASCCYVSSDTWRQWFRALREAFAACPHGTGRVTVRVTVEEDGSIVEACLEHPSSFTEESRACLLAATLNLRLPSEDYEFCPVRRVVYPFQFE